MFVFQSLKFHRVLTIPLLAATAFALVHQASAASTFKTIHSFCPVIKNGHCLSGEDPRGALLVTQTGELYGTTYGGGKYGDGFQGGVVFKLAYDGGTGKWKETVLHNFPVKYGQNNDGDGYYPWGKLIIDVDGNLYGTAERRHNDDYQAGIVYKLTHGANGWTLKVVHGFCSSGGCADGRFPQTGLTYAGQASGTPWDKTSPLFGTTWLGGTYDGGTVFKLVYNGSTWQQTVIHNFNNLYTPNALVMDSAGNLFGTMQAGGKYGGGVIFKLAHDTWTQTIPHNFCNGCSDDGQLPNALYMDAAGNLFGTTAYGGLHGKGVVFERTVNGTYSVIYNFCSLGGTCPDGALSFNGLVGDRLGNLFGMTAQGGTGHDSNGNPAGTVFKLAPNEDGTWSESVLHSFCSKENCTDGESPEWEPPLTMDFDGNLFGTTPQGGAHGGGTVFKIHP
jgi:uncharacterized repeat protein (TIGR03803 family)